jgi:hypothetical protein
VRTPLRAVEKIFQLGTIRNYVRTTFSNLNTERIFRKISFNVGPLDTTTHRKVKVTLTTMMANSTTGWDEADPLYSHEPVHVAKLKAYIAVGSFVRCTSSSAGDNAGTILGRIVRRADENDGSVILNMFKLLTEMSYAHEICRRTEGEAQGITEVVQTMEWRSITTHEIIDVCFVFTEERMSTAFSVCTGMENCFFCRFRSDRSPVGSLMTFPSEHPDHSHTVICFALRVWNSIEGIRDRLVKLLNRTGEKQGVEFCRNSEKMPLDPEAWFYLLQKLAPSVTARESVSRILRFRILQGMIGSKKSVERPSEILRFESEDQLETFRRVFGATITYGFRHPKPRVGQTQCIAENFAIHVMYGAEELEQPFLSSTKKVGIDLIFDQVDLKIIARYTKFLYEHDQETGELKDPNGECPLHFRLQLEGRTLDPNFSDSNDENDEPEYQIGGGQITEEALFQWTDGRVYEVEKVRQRYVLVRCIHPPEFQGVPKRIDDLRSLAEAIDEYN